MADGKRIRLRKMGAGGFDAATFVQNLGATIKDGFRAVDGMAALYQYEAMRKLKAEREAQAMQPQYQVMAGGGYAMGGAGVGYGGGGQELPMGAMTGEYMFGVPEEQATAEVERGEYVQSPDGRVAEVAGGKHGGGGVPTDAEGYVVSDRLPLGAEAAKALRDEYDIDVKAGDSYATAIDKYKKKLGLKAAYEKQAGYMEKLKAVSGVSDKATAELNKKYLSGKILEAEREIESLLPQLEAFTAVIYELQEAGKSVSGDEGVDEVEEYSGAGDGGVVGLGGYRFGMGGALRKLDNGGRIKELNARIKSLLSNYGNEEGLKAAAERGEKGAGAALRTYNNLMNNLAQYEAAEKKRNEKLTTTYINEGKPVPVTADPVRRDIINKWGGIDSLRMATIRGDVAAQRDWDVLNGTKIITPKTPLEFEQDAAKTKRITTIGAPKMGDYKVKTDEDVKLSPEDYPALKDQLAKIGIYDWDMLINPDKAKEFEQKNLLGTERYNKWKNRDYTTSQAQNEKEPTGTEEGDKGSKSRFPFTPMLEPPVATLKLPWLREMGYQDVEGVRLPTINPALSQNLVWTLKAIKDAGLTGAQQAAAANQALATTQDAENKYYADAMQKQAQMDYQTALQRLDINRKTEQYNLAAKDAYEQKAQTALENYENAIANYAMNAQARLAQQIQARNAYNTLNTMFPNATMAGDGSVRLGNQQGFFDAFLALLKKNPTEADALLAQMQGTT
jgi:hypothetical protein